MPFHVLVNNNDDNLQKDPVSKIDLGQCSVKRWDFLPSKLLGLLQIP